jgi:hypothetical protein
MPFTIVLAAAAVACRIPVDMRAGEPDVAAPVPDSGPDSSWFSCGEWPSAGLGAGAEACVTEESRLVVPVSAACGEPPADDRLRPASAATLTAAKNVTPILDFLVQPDLRTRRCALFIRCLPVKVGPD